MYTGWDSNIVAAIGLSEFYLKTFVYCHLYSFSFSFLKWSNFLLAGQMSTLRMDEHLAESDGPILSQRGFVLA